MGSCVWVALVVVAQVHHVEEIVYAQRKHKIVAARRAGVEPDRSSSAAQAAPAHAVAAAFVSKTLAGFSNPRAHADHLAQPKMKHGIRRPRAHVERNHALVLARRVGVQASVLRRDYARCAADPVSRPRVELVVPCQVIADRQVVRRPALRLKQ